jgi:hypothetical protein
MIEDYTVYTVTPSMETYRPAIEFDAPVNEGIDWLQLDAILQGRLTIADYRVLSVVVRSSDATSWHYYSVPGTLGLISATALQVIDRVATRLYDFLPAKINDSDYFFLRPLELLACLDLSRSEVVTFRSNPSRIKDIKKFAFNKAAIPNPLIFSIPEFPGLFATQDVQQAIIDSRLSGFYFTPVG